MQQFVERGRFDVDAIDVLQLARELRRLAKCRHSDTAESDRRHYLPRQSVALFEQTEQLSPVFGPGSALTACAVHIDLEHVPTSGAWQEPQACQPPQFGARAQKVRGNGPCTIKKTCV